MPDPTIGDLAGISGVPRGLRGAFGSNALIGGPIRCPATVPVTPNRGAAGIGSEEVCCERRNGSGRRKRPGSVDSGFTGAERLGVEFAELVGLPVEAVSVKLGANGRSAGDGVVEAADGFDSRETAIRDSSGRLGTAAGDVTVCVLG